MLVVQRCSGCSSVGTIGSTIYLEEIRFSLEMRSKSNSPYFVVLLQTAATECGQRGWRLVFFVVVVVTGVVSKEKGFQICPGCSSFFKLTVPPEVIN